jgi:hypothetical protein
MARYSMTSCRIPYCAPSARPAQRAGLRLRLADAPELANLPVEFLYDPRHNRFLGPIAPTRLVRYLDLPDPPHPLSVEGPLRLLVMISNPSGYPILHVEHEWNALPARGPGSWSRAG